MPIDLILLAALLLVLALLVSLGRRLAALEARLGETPPAPPLFDQFTTYLYLRDRLGLRQGLPFTKDWSASPDFLRLVVEHCLEAKPRRILECGSGVSSLMLAACCRLNGKGQLISLEQDAGFVRQTQAHLDRYGLTPFGQARHAPLVGWRIGDREEQWYDPRGLDDERIDLLVIDGPPAHLLPRARYPALPLLRERLAEGCVIFLDDAARPGERAIVADWLQQWPEFGHEYIKTERGCSVLRLRVAPTPVQA